MHQINVYMSRRAWLALITAASLWGGRCWAADPVENPVQQLARTQSSGLELKTGLTKNLFRQEPYQAEYQVQVPYEDTETYYVDVPYQDTETYTDYEDYYENEYRCHDRTTYERECHNENICRPVDLPPNCRDERRCENHGGGESCQDVTECGSGPHGEKVCKTRRVCHNDLGREDCHSENVCSPGGSRNECHNEQRCEDVPRSRQECGYESVLKTRPVTKTRTVTRYRKEARTRTVTRYRDETRCCVTKYRDVFDHQATLAVRVVFPVGSELLENEKEAFVVEMTSEKEVSLVVQSSVLNYKIQAQALQGTEYVIQLALVPKYSEAELGQGSVKELVLLMNSDGVRLSFVDNGLRPRVKTAYSYQILEKAGNRLVDQGLFASVGEKNVLKSISAALSHEVEYLVQVRVQRIGVVLAAPIDFTVQAIKSKDPLNPDQFVPDNLVHDLAVRSSLANTRLMFVDNSPDIADVKTTYQVKVVRRSGFLYLDRTTMAEATVARAEVSRKEGGVMEILFKDHLHMPQDELEGYLDAGRTLFITLQVARQSDRLNGGQPISIVKELETEVPHEP